MLLWAFYIIFNSFYIYSGFYVDSICKVNNPNNSVYLTFDDGPCENTLKILDLLEKYNAKASFFLIGKNIEANKEILEDIYKRGHRIGLHSYSHSKLFPLFSPKKMIKDIRRNKMLIKYYIGEDVDIFRPPFGITNPSVYKAVKKLNLKVIAWNIRSFDTVRKNPEKVLNKIKKKISSGSVILLHDHTELSLEILERLILFLKKKNYSINAIDL